MKIFALPVLMALQGCAGIGALEALGGRCTQDELTVTFHPTITRGAATSSNLLTYTLTPSNVSGNQFGLLRSRLVDGNTPEVFNVTWTVSAFETNGGYISFSHDAPIANGVTLPVNATFNGAGWGADATISGRAPMVSVRAENFTATTASGTITSLGTFPQRLRIDVTVRNAGGEDIRIAGDAGFSYARVTKTCT